MSADRHRWRHGTASSLTDRLSQDRFAALLGPQEQKCLGQSEKERSARGQKSTQPHQSCGQPSRSHRGLLAIFFPLAKSLSHSGGLLKERLRSAPKLLSDKELPTLQPVENH